MIASRELLIYLQKKKIRGYPLASPNIGEQELANIVDVVKSGWISSRGSYISSLKKFEKYLGEEMRLHSQMELMLFR